MKRQVYQISTWRLVETKKKLEWFNYADYTFFILWVEPGTNLDISVLSMAELHNFVMSQLSFHYALSLWTHVTSFIPEGMILRLLKILNEIFLYNILLYSLEKVYFLMHPSSRSYVTLISANLLKSQTKETRNEHQKPFKLSWSTDTKLGILNLFANSSLWCHVSDLAQQAILQLKHKGYWRT